MVASAVRNIAGYAYALGTPFYDWSFYAAAVDRWLAGTPIYPGARISTLVTAPGTSYSYPPASVPLMLPFASQPFGLMLWETVIVATLLVGIWLVVRVGWPGHPLRAFGVALGVISFLDPVMQGIAVGNANIATAGLLGFMWAGTRGVIPTAGVMTVVKVFPFALSAPFGVRAMARAGFIAAVICAVTLPMVGIQSWADYLTGLNASQPLCNNATVSNPSVACMLDPYVAPLVAKWAGLLIAGAMLLVAMRAGRSFVGAAAVTIAIMAPATELHPHYFSIVIVLACIWLATIRQSTTQPSGRAEVTATW